MSRSTSCQLTQLSISLSEGVKARARARTSDLAIGFSAELQNEDVDKFEKSGFKSIIIISFDIIKSSHGRSGDGRGRQKFPFI